MKSVEKLLNLSVRSELPVIFQTEGAECGLACLAMIAGYFGYKTDMAALRQRFAISSHGSTLSQVMNVAGRMHLSPRAVKLDLDSLKKLQLPCMLHWDLNHFVVLKKITHGKYIIHDPVFGVRRFGIADLSRHFTGVAVEFTPTSSFVPKKNKRQLRLRHFWDSITGIKRSLAHVVALALLLQLFAVISPFYMQLVLDDVILHSDLSLLLVLALGFGLLLLVEAATSLFRSIVILNLSTRLSIQMASNLYRHLIRLPLDYFQKRHMGDVLSRVGSLENIKQMITSGVVAAIVDGLMAVLTLLVMFYYSAKLTLISLAVVGIYAIFRYVFFQPIKLLSEEGLVAGAKMNSHNIESLRAIETIKIFQKEGDRQNQWHNKMVDVMNNGIRVSQWGMGFGTASHLLFGFESIVVLYFGAKIVIAGDFSVGMMMAFFAYKGRFTGSINTLIDQWIAFKMIDVHLDRLADIAFTPEEEVDNHENFSAEALRGNGELTIYQQAQLIKGKIEVRNLSFTYGENEAPVFTGLNFIIEAGETVAIVGASGCGKTTLLRCLMGMLQPSAGEILIDDIPLNKMTSYRSQICGVMQDDQLISGSLRENVACFSPQIDMDRVIFCAKLACIHNEIMAMPMQYDTLIGDMGSSLSGGQKQRVILARAAYREPRILFMDEATSHLDTTNEALINHHVKNLNITRILVAHRPETIASADRKITLA